MDRVELTAIVGDDREPTASLTLPFETRQRSRFRTRLDDGREAGVHLPRGRVLRGGDRLAGPAGDVVVIEAAPEPVSTAFHRDCRRLARAAYHLGNRHVPLQVGETWLRYRADHVLDDLAEALELRVFHEQAPFEPEAGAFDGTPGSASGQAVAPWQGHVHPHG